MEEISFPPRERVRQEGIRWAGKGERVPVGPFILENPLAYVSSGPSREEEASCIDLRLPIGQPIDEPPGSLDLYPQYTRLSPDQRANYLEWMASGRTASLHDIGYAFLFFYGLERRLLIEQADLSPIVKEVVRLLETYTFSGSFDRYLSQFLAYTLARANIATLKDKWFEAVFERTRAQRDEQHLAVGLAWLYARSLPLPARWAMRIARLDPRSPRSVVLDRLPDQFHALFAKRYREQYGDGISLKASKRDREITYRPASPTLLDTALISKDIRPVLVPNVMGIQSQFKPLVEIWTSCIEELKPLSRVVGRGAVALTREAFETLPEALQAETEHPDKPHWDKIAAENAREDGMVVLAVGRLAAIHGIEKRAKLTAKQSESLARTAHHVGFLIEPDVRIVNRPYSWDEVVALLRPEDPPELPKDSRYAGASLMLELGMFVAAADGDIEDDEVDHIARFLESRFLLDPPDARRLEALKRVLTQRSPSLAGVARRLEAVLNADQREAVGRFLVGVAAANGSIDKKEITALRNAYKALGVDVDRLNGLLEEFRSTAAEPVEVLRPSGPPSPGEAIPSRPEPHGGITLDEGLLRKILGETQAVARMLGEAMRETEPEASEPAGRPAPPVPVADPRFDGLDVRYHAALAEMVLRPSWTRADFETLVRRHSLMPSGTVDVANEWSQERHDDLIIEEQGEYLIVNQGLITEQT